MRKRTVSIPVALLVSALGASSASAQVLWKDATSQTIGSTGEWTSKLELADVNGDGKVDILFANGGDYSTPGDPTNSRVFLNKGAGKKFTEASQILGDDTGLSRVIKVRDVTGDGNVDIVVGGSHGTQTRLFQGDGKGGYQDATANLPQKTTSAGDLEIGDIDGDRDLDIVIADWGAGDPCEAGTPPCSDSLPARPGVVPLVWRNKGDGKFEDATSQLMPTTAKVKWSWDFELADLDNDMDLDMVFSSKSGKGGTLLHNDGKGKFTDKTSGGLPQFTNNYEYEPIDINGDGFLDLVTINDGPEVIPGDTFNRREHAYLNDGKGGFGEDTPTVWPDSENIGADDNVIVVLDFDSDGDPDFLIGSLSGDDRLLVNNKGVLELREGVIDGPGSPGTLGLGVADLNGDGKLDVVESQGEIAEPEMVYLGSGIAKDTAPPIVDLADKPARKGTAFTVRARVHDNKTPVMPHDFTGAPTVKLKLKAGDPIEAQMVWYGGALWRADIELPEGAKTDSYVVCATDAAGNEKCTAAISAAGGGGDNADCAAGASCEEADESGGCATGGRSGLGAALLLLAAIATAVVRRRRRW